MPGGNAGHPTLYSSARRLEAERRDAPRFHRLADAKEFGDDSARRNRQTGYVLLVSAEMVEFLTKTLMRPVVLCSLRNSGRSYKVPTGAEAPIEIDPKCRS